MGIQGYTPWVYSGPNLVNPESKPTVKFGVYFFWLGLIGTVLNKERKNISRGLAITNYTNVKNCQYSSIKQVLLSHCYAAL